MNEDLIFLAGKKEVDYPALIKEKSKIHSSFKSKFIALDNYVFLNDYKPFHNAVLLRHFIKHRNQMLYDNGTGETIAKIIKNISDIKPEPFGNEKYILFVSTICIGEQHWIYFLNRVCKFQTNVEHNKMIDNPNYYYELYRITF